MDKYSIFEGKFSCKTCKKEVRTMRVYKSTGIASWMCQEKHLTEVELFKVGYKKLKSHE